MQVRRCAVLWLEPREVSRFQLGSLLSGGTGVVSDMRWIAHAPHLAETLEVTSDDAAFLGTMSPTDWVASDHPRTRPMLEAGLLIARDGFDVHRDADARLREQHWYGLSAVLHAASRWSATDAAGEVQEAGLVTGPDLRAAYGAPPPTLHDRGPAEARIPLARAPRTQLDDLFDQRNTCRNFDISSDMPQAQFANVLERAFGALAQVEAAEDFEVLKKTSPSGGALHPTEAYVVVQRVEGIAPGLYHYRAGDHALQPLPGVEDLAKFAFYAVGGQQWFADAHVLVVLAPRFHRNFWKYRNHAKAYRVTILDVGHLSQTLLLSATALGLGSFVTAAINEGDIEEAFGLTSYVDGPLAVCGFGIRSETMTTSEFDPSGKVWPS